MHSVCYSGFSESMKKLKLCPEILLRQLYQQRFLPFLPLCDLSASSVKSDSLSYFMCLQRSYHINANFTAQVVCVSGLCNSNYSSFAMTKPHEGSIHISFQIPLQAPCLYLMACETFIRNVRTFSKKDGMLLS